MESEFTTRGGENKCTLQFNGTSERKETVWENRM
jgi:hypothetical protein